MSNSISKLFTAWFCSTILFPLSLYHKSSVTSATYKCLIWIGFQLRSSTKDTLKNWSAKRRLRVGKFIKSKTWVSLRLQVSWIQSSFITVLKGPNDPRHNGDLHCCLSIWDNLNTGYLFWFFVSPHVLLSHLHVAYFIFHLHSISSNLILLKC